MIRTLKIHFSILCLYVFGATAVLAQSVDHNFIYELEAAAEVESEQTEIDADATTLLNEELGSADGWETAATLPTCWMETRCGTQYAGFCGSGFRRVTHAYRCCAVAGGGKSCTWRYTSCGC